MKKTRGSRRNPDPAARAAVRAYRALHDGLPPARVAYVKPKRAPRYLVDLGDVHAIEYRRRVDDDGDGQANATRELYRHQFAAGAGPELYYDERGQLHPSGGRYKVTERGITDMKHRRRHYLGFIPRVNPDLTHAQIITRGVGTALVAIGANKALDTLLDPFFSTDRTRSLVKGGTAAVIGLMVAKRYPFVGAGFVAAGALEIIQLGYREFGLDSYEARARDRVAAYVAGMRRPTAGVGTGSLYDMNGRPVSSLNAPRGVDPQAIRQQMANAAAR